MKIVAIAISCVLAFSLAGCAPAPVKSNSAPVVWTKSMASPSEVDNAKGVVTNQLKDPESARYGEIWAMDGTNGHRAICGYVNAKNSYGGYTGQKMFMLNSGSVIFEGSGPLGNLLPGLCTPRTVK